MKKLLFILILLPVLAFGQKVGMWANGWRFSTPPPGSNLLFDAGYEEATSLNTQSPALLTPEYRSSSEEKNSTVPYVAFVRDNTVSASGSYSLRVTLDEDYPLDDRFRAERTFYNMETPIMEQWYRVKYFLPEDFEMEANIVQLFQFHSLDNEGDSDKIPALSFYINGDGDYDVNIAYSDEYVSSFPYPNVHYTPFNSPEDDFGSWVTIIIHARWDYREDIDGGDGLIELWKDGVLEITHNGPNCFFDDLGVYFKWGLMKLGSWVTTADEKIVYFDDIRVGTEDADYAEMTAKNSINLPYGEKNIYCASFQHTADRRDRSHCLPGEADCQRRRFDRLRIAA